MKIRISGLASAAFALAGCFGSAQSLAQNAYITNELFNTVSVIDAATNTVTATISVGVAVTPDGSKAYVANTNSTTVIDTGTNTVAATTPVGNAPTAFGLFIQPELRFAGTPARQTASATA
jgi:YVTN family beta-propeller protein